MPIRGDLAHDCATGWTPSCTERVLTHCGIDRPVPLDLRASTPLFVVPAALVKILDRDLRAAGIPQRRWNGAERLMFIALRHTFGRLLSCVASPPHGSSGDASFVYQFDDEHLHRSKLLDVHSALDSLPALPLRCVCASQTSVDFS